MADNEYDWPDEDLVIHPQGETAVYRNAKEATVIRQRDPFGDEQFVVISPQYLPALITRLQQHHQENEERKRG